MARRRPKAIPEDTRPLGSVHWADPSRNGMADRIRTFNFPHDSQVSGEGGIRSAGYPYNSSALSSHAGDRQWAAMQRRKGVSDEE